jgi:CRT-like, chloroquine-resistance transporter-like
MLKVLIRRQYCDGASAFIFIFLLSLVSVCSLANLAYNVLIILLIKYGSSNILWLCLTLQVPVANLAFALPFMPNSKPITWEDGVGLVVIMLGLCIYRFYKPLTQKFCGGRVKKDAVAAGESVTTGLLEGDKTALPAASAPLALPGSVDDGSNGAGLLAIASDSPGSNLGGSTPVLGLHVPRATKNKAGTGAHVPTAAEKAAALREARQRKEQGGASGAGSGPSRQRGGSR